MPFEALEKGPLRNPAAPRVLFADRRFATPSGRVNLLCEAPPAATLPAQPSEDYPLWLMALSTDRSQSSQWSTPPENPAVVTVHPWAAAGVADGGLAHLESPHGRLLVRVRHDPKQRRDVLLAAKGGHLSRGMAMNALIAARTTDLGDGGALYDERVRLVPAPPTGR